MVTCELGSILHDFGFVKGFLLQSRFSVLLCINKKISLFALRLQPEGLEPACKPAAFAYIFIISVTMKGLLRFQKAPTRRLEPTERGLWEPNIAGI